MVEETKNVEVVSDAVEGSSNVTIVAEVVVVGVEGGVVISELTDEFVNIMA